MKGRFIRVNRGFPKSLSSLWAWISVSYGVLPILIFGMTSLLINRTGSSGAVLVGCTIVAQALLQLWPMAGIIGGRKSGFQIRIEALNPNLRGFQAYSGYDPDKAEDKLKIIAIKDELDFKAPQQDARWLKELTISRVFLSLEWCIVICAVVGTLVWAYVPQPNN